MRYKLRSKRATIDAPVGGPPSTTTYLPFDMPSDATYDSSTFIVAPHAMATWRRAVQDKNIETDPTSYEQANWVPPGHIEGPTDHRVWGGYVRNYPKGRNPLGTDVNGYAYTLQDKIWEIQQMKAAGFRHATIDILGEDTFSHAIEWGRAATIVGNFKCIAMPDASVSIVRNGAANLISYLKQLFGGSYANGWAKHTDGRWLIMPYGPEFAVSGATAESQIITYWQTVMSTLATDGYSSALWCCFSNNWLDAASYTALTFNKAALASYVVGFGQWGVGDPQTSAATNEYVGGAPAYSHSTFSKNYLYTIRVEDSRPATGLFFEAGGWENIMVACNQIVASLPYTDAVQISTWNDWFEGSGVAPSIDHGWVDLDVLSYYVHRLRLGSFPTIVRDTLYLAHRVQQTPTYAPQPTYTANPGIYTLKMAKGTGAAERNQVDVMVFATASGTVEINVNGTVTSVAVSAGVSRVQAPLGAGTISCVMKRSGTAVTGTSITSPYPVNFTTQLVQDLTYRRMSSRR